MVWSGSYEALRQYLRDFTNIGGDPAYDTNGILILLLALADNLRESPAAMADLPELAETITAEQSAFLGQLSQWKKSSVSPPGDSPADPAVKDIDPVAFALNRVRTHLFWIAEHQASFEVVRESNPAEAERELGYLAHSSQKAMQHMKRLVELLLAGYTIDPSKRLPTDLARLAKPPAAPDRGEQD